MLSQSTAAVIEFLVSQSAARVEKIVNEIGASTEEYCAIFDELDSLAREEFAEVYAVYLVGSGREHDFGQAHRAVAVAKFLPLEGMAQDVNLHLVLARGVEMHRRYVQKG